MGRDFCLWILSAFIETNQGSCGSGIMCTGALRRNEHCLNKLRCCKQVISSTASHQLLPDLYRRSNCSRCNCRNILWETPFCLDTVLANYCHCSYLFSLSLVDIPRFLYSTTGYWEFLVL